MNIKDHLSFTKNLLNLDILKPYLETLTQDEVVKTYWKQDSFCWEVSININRVKMQENYQLSDINIHLTLLNQNYAIVNYETVDVEFLDLLLDFEALQAENKIHLIAIEEIANNRVQYICIIDNVHVIPDMPYMARNANLLDDLQTLFSQINVAINKDAVVFNNEIILTHLGDLRNKVTNIITYNHCDDTISLTLSDLGYTEEDIMNMREQFFIVANEEIENFNEIPSHQQEELFFDYLMTEFQYLVNIGRQTENWNNE